MVKLRMELPILEIKNLCTHFLTPRGIVKAVDDVSLSMGPREMVGIVGESGCGKSVLARSILRLVPCPPGRHAGGQILFSGNNLLSLSEKEMQKIRGGAISMIFQEPMTALNPVYTVGYQIAEVFRKHQKINKKDALERAVEMLRTVGIPAPETRINEYPFQMSGGMRQRVVTAMALACQPKLILADEPTTALDVTIQAQILRSIQDLESTFGTSMILITHDLGVIAESVQRVLVMYAGQVVEEAKTEDIFASPLHPYTEGLMNSILSLEEGQNKDTRVLKEIRGIVPDLSCLPAGCYFYPRCDRRMNSCREAVPRLKETKPGRRVRCWLYE